MICMAKPKHHHSIAYLTEDLEAQLGACLPRAESLLWSILTRGIERAILT
jgi:hypothetical protein